MDKSRVIIGLIVLLALIICFIVYFVSGQIWAMLIVDAFIVVTCVFSSIRDIRKYIKNKPKK